MKTDSHLIAISIPAETRFRIASQCHGLPQVRWTEEENFHLTLRHLGPLSEYELSNIQERLLNLFFHPFTVVVKGMNQSHSRSNRGTLWMEIAEQPQLNQLKLKIDSLLKDFKKIPGNKPFRPHITLGHYDKINPEKLFEYLSMHAEIGCLAFEVASCALMHVHQTPKRMLLEIAEEYPASKPGLGED